MPTVSKMALLCMALMALFMVSVYKSDYDPVERTYEGNKIALSCLEGEVIATGVDNGKQYMVIKAYMECENGC